MKSKDLWTKGPEWNNAAYEEKEKYHYLTHPAQDPTNSIIYRKRMGTLEERKPTPGERKNKQRKKTGGKLKKHKLFKLK